MNKVMWGIVFSVSLAGAVEVREVCFKIVENVLYCKSVITEESLIPQVCGRCELEFKEGRLYIKETKGCPRYDAWACQTSEGELFLINNLSCTPSGQERKEGNKLEKEKLEIYKVRIMGEFCLNLLKKKFDVVKEGIYEAVIKVRKEDLKKLPHCVASYERVALSKTIAITNH